jgi:uncharacterized protein (TIGR02996 family)
MDTQGALLSALHLDPFDLTPRLALADWLEEQGRTSEAELTRCQYQLDTCPENRGRRKWEQRVQTLLAEGVRPIVPLLTLQLSAKVSLLAALIPPGTFWMGASQREAGRFEDELPRHRVTIARPFYLAIYPVTQAQWQAVHRQNPAHFKGPNRPADRIGFYDAEEFCARASKKTRRRVRLPSEAEWEYACRAGTTTPFAGGRGSKAMNLCGWCDDAETHSVGRKQPNGWGLYDMHGNVWEWCQDVYTSYSDPVPAEDEEEHDSNVRVARGGSYSNPAGVCRSACRIGFMGGGRNEFIGFRVAIDWEAAE